MLENILIIRALKERGASALMLSKFLHLPVELVIEMGEFACEDLILNGLSLNPDLLYRWYANSHASLFLKIYEATKTVTTENLAFLVAYDKYRGQMSLDAVISIDQCFLLARNYDKGLLCLVGCEECAKSFVSIENQAFNLCIQCKKRYLN